jgi:hypothetical protein
MSSLDLATATATVTQALLPVFLSYAAYHAINPTFMIHGLTLLARFLDLRRSHHGSLSFLMPETHLIDLGSCVNVVYLKLWGTQISVQTGNTLIVNTGLNTRAYVGQTANPRARESSLQAYLRELGQPMLHICVGHGLVQYHKDTLECALIAWSIYAFGLAVLNRSPYANNFYLHVQAGSNLDNMLPEDYTFRRSNHRLVRTIFIGTAPPATIAQAAAYLQREPGVTLMNWNRFPIHSGLTRLRVQIDQEAHYHHSLIIGQMRSQQMLTNSTYS